MVKHSEWLHLKKKEWSEKHRAETALPRLLLSKTESHFSAALTQQAEMINTLTDALLVVSLCVPDVLELKLSQALGELALGHRQLCNTKETEEKCINVKC